MLSLTVPLLAAVLNLASVATVEQAGPATGLWHAWLESPGGAIPFGLELARTGICWEGWIRNGEERQRIGRVERSGAELVLHLDPYDSRVRATVSADGRALAGEWERYRGPERWTRMAFRATAGNAARFPGRAAPPEELAEVLGRWSVRFAESEDPAVAVFGRFGDAGVQGTFLTTLGDYRFLEGGFDGRQLSLSCFDGAHAFLFTAQLGDDGRLNGDFWSRDTWHETWSAERDPDASLPDPFELTRWTGAKALGTVVFPDIDGSPRALDDPEFAGRARILVLFGTWCPNCYDASTYLRELHNRYRARGLSILGLAFEFGDTFERNARVVRHYVEHKELAYPVLIAGPSDKEQAGRAFPLLDRVRAYPTFVFLDAAGAPRAVYTGFSGPATGPAHERLREQFERILDELLTEK